VGALLTALARSDPPVLFDPDLARLRAAGHPREIEEFLRATFEAQAARHPLAISIDDLQWADHTTLFLLARLPPALFSVPILWLLASRSSAAAPPLQSALSRLADAGAVRVGLGPLDADSAVAVAADLLGGHPDRVLAGLLEQAGGNPFYLVELVHALKSDGQMRVRRRTAELVEAGERGRLPGAGVRPTSHAGATGRWVAAGVRQLRRARSRDDPRGADRVDELGVYQTAREGGALSVRVRPLIRVPNDVGADAATAMIRGLGIHSGFGDDWLRVWGLKLVMDGGVEGGAMEQPYANDAANSGHLNWDPDIMFKVCLAAIRGGWRVGTHAVGDRAVRVVLDVYERVTGTVGGLPPATLSSSTPLWSTPPSRRGQCAWVSGSPCSTRCCGTWAARCSLPGALSAPPGSARSTSGSPTVRSSRPAPTSCGRSTR
jgi:hypothetical protein